MPNTPTPPYHYYPKLSDLITLDNIPSSLDFVKSFSKASFQKYIIRTTRQALAH